MADISACTAIREDKDHKCPKRHWCYRYLCDIDPIRQSYVETPDYNENGCELFWKIGDSK